MTKSALHFAHQGGIEPSRYRNACQFCDSSSPEEVDLSFELLGIHTAENLVLNFKSSEVARTLGIDRLNGQTVPEEITLNRERILQKLNDWRGQALAYATSHLDDDQKNINGLIEHLNACSTCRQVLQDFCPLWDIEWLRKNTGDVVLSMEAWLKKCSGCGICEEECPEGFPLFSVILFNNKSLRKHYD
jgi:Pyruvate/2-oxoacid:ferredoxin oxidoreductase delta subunit